MEYLYLIKLNSTITYLKTCFALIVLGVLSSVVMYRIGKIKQPIGYSAIFEVTTIMKKALLLSLLFNCTGWFANAQDASIL